MPRALIASNLDRWSILFVHGYRQNGFETVTGIFNLEFENCTFDIIHLNWPEELIGWAACGGPTQHHHDKINALLSRWKQKSKIIFSVNNLYPHGQRASKSWHKYYTMCYGHAHIIHHFSHASHHEFVKIYPALATHTHIITSGFNYAPLYKESLIPREEYRKKLGLKSHEFVYLVFGSLRHISEVNLLHQAYSQLKLKNKRLVMAARYAPVHRRSSLRRYTESLKIKLWNHSHHVISIIQYLPDDQLHDLFNAIDACVVLRNDSISSGVPCLAMTFGKLVIAPNHGACPEYLGNAGNLLYDASSPKSLATAMLKATQADMKTVEKNNLALSAAASWDKIIQSCLNALD
jgi:glycosyltransferase involved in cell wall biosynthesis